MRFMTVLAMAMLASTVHAEVYQSADGRYWEVTETTLVQVQPRVSQYQPMDYGTIEPAAGPRIRWGGGQWQGVNVGVHVLGSQGSTKYTNPIHQTQSFDDDGGGIGGQIGYMAQMGQFVVGGEVDATALSNEGNDNYGLGQKDTIKPKWQASARVRAGIAVGDMLPYVTAGWAMEKHEYRLDDPVFKDSGTVDKTMNGPTYGAGVDVKFSEDGNTSARLEYRHTKLDDGSFTIDSMASSRTYEREIDALIFGLNYRFNKPPMR